MPSPCLFERRVMHIPQPSATTGTTIVHVITDLDVGGAEMMLLKTLPRLPEWKHVVCSLTSKGDVGERLEQAGIRVFALRAKHRFGISVVRQLITLLRQHRPVIVHTYLVHGNLVGRVAARLAHVPIVISSIRSKLQELRFIPFILLDTLTAWMVTRYVANAHALQRVFQRYGIPAKKFRILTNGIDLSMFSAHVAAAPARQRLALPADAYVLGYVAKLRPEKGHRYLLQGFQRLRATLPQAHLVLIGDGPDELTLRVFARELGLGESVRFLGRRTDVPELLHALDVFVLPSEYEGMSNALLEAMACGKPVVAAATPENAEVVSNGVHGLLVQGRNPEALADALRALWQDRARAHAMGAAARRRIEERYSLEASAEQLRLFYRELLSNFRAAAHSKTLSQ